MTLEPAQTYGAATAESPVSAVSWAAIAAGAVVALSVTLIMLALGSGMGAAAVSPWANSGPSVTTFTALSAIWLVLTQWFSAAIGGYLTGRLRTRWTGTHTHEVFFRDTAHGLITWAVATAVMAGLAAFIASSGAAAAAHAASAAAPQAGDATVTGQAVDAARKATAAIAICTALSMLVGAFVASVAAALGGQLRDQHP